MANSISKSHDDFEKCGIFKIKTFEEVLISGMNNAIQAPNLNSKQLQRAQERKNEVKFVEVANKNPNMLNFCLTLEIREMKK